MAWGLEARVPFLDKSFLEVAMNIDPKEKMFSKGSSQALDADGCPKMEKVGAVRPDSARAASDHPSQYVLRKAFDCAPDGKVRPRFPAVDTSTQPRTAVSAPIYPLAPERTIL